jgi:hypothetical protein
MFALHHSAVVRRFGLFLPVDNHPARAGCSYSRATLTALRRMLTQARPVASLRFSFPFSAIQSSPLVFPVAASHRIDPASAFDALLRF